MATQSNEIKSYFGRCRCCLEYGYLKNMWTVHHWEGEGEIYGEMITQCFAFSLEQIKGVDKDQLCATCITRLRDACNFKYMIIRSQRILMQEDVCEGDSLNFKLERVKPENTFDSDTGDDTAEDTADDTKDVPEQIEEMEIIQMDEKTSAEEHSYEDVEYLEEEIVTEKAEEEEEPEVSDSKLDESDDSKPPKPKWPKKLPRNERNKRYMQYTEEDLRKSIEAVKTKKMSRLEAAQYYNVPRKTLTAKLRQHSENVAENDNSEQSIHNSQTFIDNLVDASEYQSHKSSTRSGEEISDIFVMDKYRHNLSTILQFSNATMIHGYWGVGYSCYFCTRQFPLASQLKRHNLRSHRKSVNPIEQDNESNLLLKLDITDLNCKVCKLKISSLKKLTKHLKKIHGKVFHDVKNYIVPFKFDTEQLQCALCAKKFEHFKLLSDHTVEHFQNFECWLCNHWFINQHALELHLYRHQGGAYECSYCSKIFDTASEKSEHVRIVHYLSNKTTQCPHCDDAFQSNLQLEKHKAEIHGIKQQVYECRSCSITFVNETYLTAHQTRFHLLVRPHKCFTCYMSFYSQIELNMHRIKDKDSRKFACEICEKKYSTRCKLNQHSLLHFDHRRFSCHYCNLNFVLKYKWKEHMRNIHPKIITLDSGQINPDREERYKFLTEIKTILTFTNGTPFKTRMSRYCCAYCTDVCFNDPVELRNHTRTTHMDDRTKKVDLMMRPYFMNEILKLDIENLLCVVCCTPIYKWNNMFHHLKDKHQIELDLAYRKVIPFTLDADLKCALCSEPYINYMQLDGHMNSHYNNYVCGDCGDTFLTAPRLKSHMKIHMTGKYPCNHCEKVFKLEHYKKKHEAVVHKISLYYKCSHCGMKFGSERERKNHVTEVHSDKVKIITCEQCGKTFNWRHYFVSHLRKSHSDRKHECPHCDKRFVDKSDLDGHIAAKHDGEKKHQCLSCNKKYSSRPGLLMHLRAHRNCAIAMNQSTELEYIFNE